MKKTILSAFLCFSAIALYAQAPSSLNYQGVARSASGTPLVSQPIGMRLTVHDGSPSGTVVYQETQTTTTNAYGLYSVSAGTGTVVSGTFTGINWASGNKYLEVELDATGGTSYSSVGASKLNSVPYALYSNTAGSANTATSLTGTVTMGGDVTGTNAASSVAKLQGNAVSATAPTAGQVLTWDAVTSSWKPITPAAGGTGTVTSINTAAGQLTGGPITTTGTIGLATAGTAGTYGSGTQVPVITTDAYGRVTGVTNTPITAGGTGTVTSVTAGTGLSGGVITTTGTVSMPNVGTAGTYGSATQVPVITTDAQGRVSGVTNTTITVPTVSGTTNYVAKFTGASAIGNSSVFDNGSTVGVNTTTPTNMAKLHISGVGTYSVAPVFQAGLIIDGTSTASATGMYAAGGWKGVFGHNLGTLVGTEAIGVLGRTEGSSYTGTGYGVKGEMAGTGGTANYGVYGTASGTGRGIGGFATGTGAAGYFDGGVSGQGVVVAAGNSSFGTTTPYNMAKVHISGVGTYSVAPVFQAGLVVDGTTTASATGMYAAGGWKGVFGHNLGTSTGTEAIGVLGRTEGSAYTGTGYGVKGEMAGTGGTANYGVYGTASGTGRGIGGFATGTGAAGYFDGGTSGLGVVVPVGNSGFGTAAPTNMAKLHVSGIGTYSVAPVYQAGIIVDGATTVSATGVYGSAGWKGIYGHNLGTSPGVAAIGVHGRSEGNAYTSAGYGVLAEAVGTPAGATTNYGIYATASGAPTNYAGYFSGNVRITGSITKGSGTFPDRPSA